MRRASLFDRLLVAVSVAALTAGCGEHSATSIVRDSTSNAVAPPPITLAPVAGDSQVTIPGGAVPLPLVVRARNAAGQPKAGVFVRWTADGGSRFEVDTSRTGADGTARAQWILGSAGGDYHAAASVGDRATAIFLGRVDSAAVQVDVVPDTMRLSSLGQMSYFQIRIRANGTLRYAAIGHWSGGSWPNGHGTAVQLTPVSGMLVAQAVRNGTSTFSTTFGDATLFFTAVVRQVAVATRMVIAERSGSQPDTLTLGPDESSQFAIAAVDGLGNAVTDSASTVATHWRSSAPTIVALSEAGVARGGADGLATVSADVGTRTVSAPVRVWTLSAAEIMPGWLRTCVRLTGGQIACWGYRRDEAGYGTADVARFPELTTYGTFTAFDMDGYHGCGLRDERAWCWGSNQAGALGTVSVPVGQRSDSAVLVSGGLRFASISTGQVNTCGLTPDGKAYCWGFSDGGTLGDGTYGAEKCQDGNDCASSPHAVAGGLTFTQISTGGSNSCALTADGTAYCWGFNDYGQLGSPLVGCNGWNGGPANDSFCSTTPVAVATTLRFRTIAAGDGLATCGIATTGQLYCWGSNWWNELGVAGLAADPDQPHPEPLPVAPGLRFTQVSLGYGYGCAIAEGGPTYCWGGSMGGALGTGLTRDEPVPAPVAGGLLFRSIAANGHTCGITTDGVAYCWGQQGFESLEGPASEFRLAPAKVIFQRR